MKHTATYNILQDAADHWPEDEAYSLYEFRYIDQDGLDTVRIERDIAEMEQRFLEEPDGDALIARFHAELNKLRYRP